MNPCQGWSTAYMQSGILSSLFYYALLMLLIDHFSDAVMIILDEELIQYN